MIHRFCQIFRGVAGEQGVVKVNPTAPRCEVCGRTLPEAVSEGRANVGEMTPERRAAFAERVAARP